MKHQNDENENIKEIDINTNTNTKNNNHEEDIKNSEIKIYPYTNILYRNNKNKNIISNSNNNTTITNNITNLSMSPIVLSALHNIENLSEDEKLNLSENNNFHSFNHYLKSIPNDEIEKEKNEANKIYQKIWKDEFIRFEEMYKKKNEENYENNDLNKENKNDDEK